MKKFLQAIRTFWASLLITIVAYFEDRNRAKREGRRDPSQTGTLSLIEEDGNMKHIFADAKEFNSDLSNWDLNLGGIVNIVRFFKFKKVNDKIPADVQDVSFGNADQPRAFSQNGYEKNILKEDSYLTSYTAAVLGAVSEALDRKKENGCEGPVVVVMRTLVMIDTMLESAQDVYAECVKSTTKSKSPVYFEGVEILFTTSVDEARKRGITNPSAVVQTYVTKSEGINREAYEYLSGSDCKHTVFVSVISNEHPKQLEFLKARHETFNTLVAQGFIQGKHVTCNNK